MAKIGILQDLAAGPEQTNAAQLLVDTETPRENAGGSHVYGQSSRSTCMPTLLRRLERVLHYFGWETRCTHKEGVYLDR